MTVEVKKLSNRKPDRVYRHKPPAKSRFRAQKADPETQSKIEVNIIERIRHRVRRRMEKVRERIESLADGTQVLRTNEFAELLDIPNGRPFSKLGPGQENYVYHFVDGTQVEVRCARGRRDCRVFFLEDSTALLRTMYQKEYELILANDMAQELRVSPRAILSWFKKEGGKLTIKLDEEEHVVTLHEGNCPLENRGGKPPKYMCREEYKLFKRWVEETYKEERTWQGRVRMADLKIPKKHVTVEQAGELLGEDRAYAEARITSGKIHAKKLNDRIWAISLEEVERFRQERERKKPPADYIPLWKMLKRTGVVRETYKTSLATSIDTATGDVVGTYAFLGNDGKRKEYRIHYDIDSDAWIKEADSNEIQKQTEERKQLIGKKEALKLLGLTGNELKSRTDVKNKKVNYWLPDGTLLNADYFVVKGNTVFRRPEIEAIAKLDKEFKEKIVYVDGIAKICALAQGKYSVWQLFKSHEGTISFTLNGKNHEIKPRKERKTGEELPSSKIYLLKEEAHALATWRGMNTQQTHLRLKGAKVCREEGQFRKLTIEENRVVLHSYGFGVDLSVPLDELDGELYVRNEHVRLVKCCMNLHSRTSETRAREVEAIFGELAELNPRKVSDYDTAKLVMLRDARKKESDSRTLQLMDACLGDERGREISGREITTPELVPETVEVAKALVDHPALLEQLAGGENGFTRAIPLVPELNVYVPISGDNGSRRIKREGTVLLKLALTLFDPRKGVTPSQRIDAAEEFLGFVKTKDQRFLPGLLVMGEFLIECMTSSESKATTEDKARMSELFARIDKFGRIFERVEDIESEYIVRGKERVDPPVQGEVWTETIINV